MSQRVRRWIPGSWALWVLLLVMGLTWPQDDAGRSAAQCSFLGSAGTPTLCGTADPLPTQSAGPTQSTTDPTGWGRNWFQATGLTNNTRYVVFAAEGQTFYAVERLAAACPAGQVRTFVSDNGGRTFTLRDTSVDSQTSGLSGSVRASGGIFLIAASDCGAVTNFQILRSQSGFQFVRATRPAAGLCAAGTSCSFTSIAAQGSTIIATGNAPSSRCRSTDGGTSFPSCVATAPTSSTYHAIASPTTNTWIAYDVGSDAVFRSTDDGASWTNVLAAATGGAGRGVVECLSSTICLAAGGTTIRRSTNAGLTWTAVMGEPFNNNLDGLLSFGSGVAVAWSGTADRVYRTNDFGATWNFQVIGPDIDTGEAIGDYLGGVTLNGRGVFAGTGRAATNGVAYSPIVGAGETIVAGQSGTRWIINSEGRGLTQTNTNTSNRACSEPAANTAAVVTIALGNGGPILVGGFVAFYTTAPAAPQTLTITDGATNVWLDIVQGANTPTSRSFGGYPLVRGPGGTVVATLPAGGVGVVGKLCLIAAQVPVQ